jgi:uncharacterized protein
MQWRGRGESGNVEDRRGMGVGRMGLPLGGGIGGIVLLLVLSALTGTNPLELIGGVSGPVEEVGSGAPPANDPQSQFIRVVLGDTEETFSRVFSERGVNYEEPTLVLFTDATQSACGVGQSAMGPFYCPADRKVYLDLSFFQELDQRFGAPGDFAQAYVVAHEVGHHIQTLTGLSQRVSAARQQGGEAEANALSVRQELQADCYAGVWGNYAAQKGLLDPGDVEEGLRAAAAIGDDRLQRQTQGRIVPESFTHGSSEQRVSWLKRGLESGRLESCDTFATR